MSGARPLASRHELTSSGSKDTSSRHMTWGWTASRKALRERSRALASRANWASWVARGQISSP